MARNAHNGPIPDLCEVRLTTVLRVEHRLLRVMLESRAEELLSPETPFALALQGEGARFLRN